MPKVLSAKSLWWFTLWWCGESPSKAVRVAAFGFVSALTSQAWCHFVCWSCCPRLQITHNPYRNFDYNRTYFMPKFTPPPPNRSIWRYSPGLSADSKLGCNSCSTDQLDVSIICLGFGVVVFVCGERKWLAYVAKASPSVLCILCMRVCVCRCACGHGQSSLCGHGAWSLPVVSWGPVTQGNQDTL